MQCGTYLNGVCRWVLKDPCLGFMLISLHSTWHWLQVDGKGMEVDPDGAGREAARVCEASDG